MIKVMIADENVPECEALQQIVRDLGHKIAGIADYAKAAVEKAVHVRLGRVIPLSVWRVIYAVDSPTSQQT